MSMLSVKNLDEKAFNYAVITVTPEIPQEPPVEDTTLTSPLTMNNT